MGDFREQAKRHAVEWAKDYGLGWRVPHAYARAARAPVDPRKVLLLDALRTELPEAFKVVFERLSAHPGYDVEFVSLRKGQVSAREYLANCERFARSAATAHLIFLCDASDVVSALPLRAETKVVQLWHACGAFKKWGMSTADSPFGLNRDETLRHPGYENLSLVTVSSPEVRSAYAEAMNLKGRDDAIQALGVSRTDVFFDERFCHRALRRVYDAVPAAAGKRLVLYAPTLRGKLAEAHAPDPPDFEVLREAVGETCIVLVKQHPAVRAGAPVPASCAGFAVDVTDILPIDDLLVATDVLVTDYSSVVFEFSLFGRPMAFYAPDLDRYDSSRSFYYDYRSFVPGPVLQTADELADFLRHADERFDPEQVAAFRARFMSACDGHATERILAALSIQLV